MTRIPTCLPFVIVLFAFPLFSIANAGVGYNRFTASNFYKIATKPAPSESVIALVKLTGKRTKNGNVLEWRTSNESNNKYFIIEKSEDGKNFIPFYEIVANGLLDNNYKYIDGNKIETTKYYRLKIAEIDGSYTHSNLVTITDRSLDYIAVVSLNKSPGVLQLNIDCPSEDKYILRLYNQNGSLLSQQKTFLNAGENTISFYLNEPSANIFLLNIETGKREQTIKIMR